MEDISEKREELSSKSTELIEEKSALVEQITALRQTVAQERENRNKANAEVKELKQKRIASFDEINKIRKEFDEILGLVEHLKDVVSGHYAALKEELKQRDWDYQTGVYTIKREKEMVKEMDALEKEIAKSEALHDKKKELMNLERRLRELYTEANVYHGLLINRAKESEAHHDSMIAAIKEMDTLEAKIQKIDDAIKKADSEAQKYRRKASEVRQIKINEQDREEIMQKARGILENFKGGKKVTMDELSLLHKLGLY